VTTLNFVPDPELSFWPTPADVADDLVFGLPAERTS
jgi:hypothetical protein